MKILRQERDIVLFDQRGTLHSTPNLLCPELTDAQIKLLALPPQEANPLYEDTLAECKQRLEANGVNLSAFNSVENAADVEAIRQALGYESINFYGVSYGTLLGLHLMRNHPTHLRSVILDGVVPPQTNFIPMVPKNTERIFSEFFDACAANADCRKSYPHLEETFFGLVDELNANPAIVSLTDPETGQSTNARLSGDDLINMVFQLFYMTEGFSILPKVIENVSNGDYAFLQFIWPLFAFDRHYSEGMYISVICAEDADFELADIPLEGVRSYFAEGLVSDLEDFASTCQIWGVDTLPGEVDAPVVSDVPTLLLSGQFDPITPPEFAATAAKTLANSYNYTVPGGSHGVALSGNSCVESIVSDFVSNPTRQPDNSCLQDISTIAFVANNVITVKLFAKLGQMDTTALVYTGLSGMFLLGMFSIVIVGPVLLIISAVQNRKRPASAVSTGNKWVLWASWGLVIVFNLLAVLFVTGTSIALIAPFTNTSLLFLSAVSIWFAPLFVIPYLLALTMLAIITGAFLLWYTKSGSILGRVYYIFLTLCAVGYIVMLWQTDMFTVLL